MLISSCCAAAVEMDACWDCRYCGACGEWLEPLCTCTREDFERGECHVDKWNAVRPPRRSIESVYPTIMTRCVRHREGQ